MTYGQELQEQQRRMEQQKQVEDLVGNFKEFLPKARDLAAAEVKAKPANSKPEFKPIYLGIVARFRELLPAQFGPRCAILALEFSDETSATPGKLANLRSEVAALIQAGAQAATAFKEGGKKAAKKSATKRGKKAAKKTATKRGKKAAKKTATKRGKKAAKKQAAKKSGRKAVADRAAKAGAEGKAPKSRSTQDEEQDDETE